jgi:predicted ATPase/DNA-binding winged helix-turn-helix (wHTH) protein
MLTDEQSLERKITMAASGTITPSTESVVQLPQPQHRVMKNGHDDPKLSLRGSAQIGIKQGNISITNAFNFGSFRLLPAQRLLLKDDKVVHLGSRAMEILIALVERPCELVSKTQLMARVWPNTFVEPANLTVSISALRRALGDGRDGNRFFINIPGRGYRFVAPVTVSGITGPPHPHPAHNLPANIARLIGRDDVTAELSVQLSRHRLITITGPGGVGKTVVALAVAEKLAGEFEDGVWRVDLAPISNPDRLPGALAEALGLILGSDQSVDKLIAALRDKRMLLVLDNCAHIAAAAARLSNEILRGASEVKILTTTREPLRIDGERVLRLNPLACPPPGNAPISAEDALRFSAVQLFVERVRSEMGEFVLSDADAGFVADICRTVDGLPLALEFAAIRVATLGLRRLADCLKVSLQILTSKNRLAESKQQSLYATLDWSCALLSEAEQELFRRLAAFTGEFTLPEATIVGFDDAPDQAATSELLASLVSKSLIMTDTSGSEPRFRLLATSRAYGFAKLVESGEVDSLQTRHTEHCRDKHERPRDRHRFPRDSALSPSSQPRVGRTVRPLTRSPLSTANTEECL